MIRRYVGFVVGYPKLIIALVLLVSLGLGASLGRLRIELDVDKQIPQGHPLVQIGKRLESLFGGKYLTVVGFYPKQGTVYTPEILEKVKRVTEEVEALPGVKKTSVLSLMSSQVKDIQASDLAIEVKQLAPEVPKTPEAIAEFQDRVKQNRAITSLLVSDDGRATTVMLDFDDFEKAGGAKAFFPKLEEILKKERTPDLVIEAAGAPTVVYWLSQYTRRIAGLFLLTLAMIGYLHYRAFRTLQGMFIPLVTALMGVVWALGLIGLIGVPMDPWNMMTPILLLAIGAGHSVQILKRFYEEFGRIRAEFPEKSPAEVNREAVVEATTKMGSVMLAAGTIASLSFLSLLAMNVPSMKNFGLCTSFGIMAALIIELTFIPAIRVLLPAPTAYQTEREQKKEVFDPIIEHIADVVRAGKEAPYLWISLALIALSAIGVFRLETRNTLGAQFFDAQSDLPVLSGLLKGPMEGFRLADERTAGTRVVQVLVEGKEPGVIKNPEVLKRMDELGAFASKLPVPVGKVVSVVDVLKVMNRVINDNDPKAEVLPDSPEAAAQFFLLYSMSGDADDLKRLVDERFQQAVITIYLRTDDHKEIKKLVSAVDAEAQRLFQGQPVTVAVGGGVTNAVALNETMVTGKINNLIQISVLVFVITSIALRSLVGGFLVLLPLAISALVNLGVMGWLGISLTMGTAAISAMAVGIGADYAIYFIFRVREQLRTTSDLREATARALTTSGKAIAYVASAVAGGYLCLTLSFFKVHVLLGVLVALTMVTCSAATIAFLPAVVLRLRPSFLTPKSPQ
jgi:predicted RND superfamily exporter protein